MPFGLKNDGATFVRAVRTALQPIRSYCSSYVGSCGWLKHLVHVRQLLPRDALHKRGFCCHAVSVRPSVCPSDTFVDHVKANKHIFKIFSPSGSDTILVFPYQKGVPIFRRKPPNGGVECKGYDKMTIFSQISRCISETVIVRWAHAARQFVSIEFSFHPYNI